MSAGTGVPGHVLIVVQNLPVPMDRRVWLECRALVAAGYRVSVICPRGPGDPDYAEIDGVRLHKYDPAPPASGLLGYLWEFTYSWLRTARLARRIWKRDPFDVLQACNPPDTYWALARLYRRRRVRFVYDQHDLNPEVFRSRFGEPRGAAAVLQYRTLLWLERQTYRAADHVIATNESYRDVAMTRGCRRAQDVTVVRSGPDTTRMRPVRGLPELRRGRPHLAVYLGIMGPQDGVDLVLRMLHVLVHQMGRDDLHVALLGFGDCLDGLVEEAASLGLGDRVTFTGRADARTIAEYLSTADVGIGPDPKSPLNDVSTMNKTMEYMSYAVPVVTFDLHETRVSAGDAAAYVPFSGDRVMDEQRFAATVSELLDAPGQRATMAVAGRRRAVSQLDWLPQRRAYVGVFDRLLRVERGAGPAPQDRPSSDQGTTTDEWGHELIDVEDPVQLRAFGRDRGIPVSCRRLSPIPTEWPQCSSSSWRSMTRCRLRPRHWRPTDSADRSRPARASGPRRGQPAERRVPAAEPAVQQPAELVRPALAVDRDRRPEPVQDRQPRSGQDARGDRAHPAYELARVLPGDLAHREAGPVQHQRLGHLGRRDHPGQPAADRVEIHVAAGLGEVEQRHRCHRVLVHAVDGIALDHPAGAGVVVPPPLAGRALQPADPVGAPVRGRERAGRRPRRAAGPVPGSDTPGRRSSRRAAGSARPGSDR